MPDAVIVRGEVSHVIFHGGCLGCVSQQRHGIDRCRGCKYFRFDWDKPELFIGG